MLEVIDARAAHLRPDARSAARAGSASACRSVAPPIHGAHASRTVSSATPTTPRCSRPRSPVRRCDSTRPPSWPLPAPPGAPLSTACPSRRRHGRLVRAGASLTVGTGTGARAYIAISGLVVEPVLGSASTDLRTGFGGHEGRALREGDRLRARSRHREPDAAGVATTGLRPDTDHRRAARRAAAGDGLTSGVWVATDAADRTGVRLSGEPVGPGIPKSVDRPAARCHADPARRPADRDARGPPVTGGYPVPASVIRADVGRVAQLRSGDEVRFASVTVEEAIRALRRAEAALARWSPSA